jgi:hypothetical protein
VTIAVAMAASITPAEYTRRFIEISGCLLDYRALWSTKPFEGIPPKWATTFPELSHWLMTLDDQQYSHYAGNIDDLNHALSAFIPAIADLQKISKLNSFSTTVNNSQYAYINKGVAGRKWQQICDFSAVFDHTINPIETPIVEWCAGKSHLGRLLNLTTKQAVTALEIDSVICQSGQQLAQRDKACVNHINCNVIDHGEDHIDNHHTVVALHACGDLHTHLLKIAGSIKPSTLAIAPCCYQLTKHQQKTWLSDIGQQSRLQLCREDLKIALMDTVIATKRNIKIRNKFNEWRLGFDEIQRMSVESNSYLPVPSLPEKLLKGSFKEFCQHVAKIKKIDIKEPINYQYFEQLGIERYKKTQRYSLVRYIFRRPLEVLLNLDYCLFLQQHNYSVQLGEFSDYQTTPRNIMLLATQLKG